ncbi:AAA family ATPase [bacterium]|nr:AAA family ATPase [bacterium]
MDKQITPPNQPERKGPDKLGGTAAARRRLLEDLLLSIKLASQEERIALIIELAGRDELTLAERRQVLIATQRYLVNARTELPREIAGLLWAILRLANRQDLRRKALELFRTAMEAMPRTEVVPQLKEPLLELVKQLLPRGTDAEFSPELFQRASRRLLNNDNSESVIHLISLGLFFFPFNGPLREMRAEANLDCGRTNSAMSDFEELVEQFPERLNFRLARAEAAIRLGEYEEAMGDLEVYLKHNPDDPEGLRKKGECLFHQGRHFESLSVLNELLKLEGDSAELFVNRARVNEQLEFLDDAQQDAERALELDKGNQEARQLRQSIMFRRQSYGMEDDLYSAFVRGDEELFLGELKIPETRFADIGGLNQIKQSIRETIEYPLKFPEVSERYGKTAGGGLLFFGPPGCGKTMLARAAAGECGVTLVNVNLAHVLDKWVGNSEKAVSMVFAAARKRAPSILFFDEVDAIGGNRANLQTGWEKKLISQLLIELDGLTSINENVMVLAATNTPWEVDFALRRPGRLGRLVFVPPPDAGARAEILKLYLEKKPFIEDGIDYAAFGAKLEHYSPDAIRQVVENAAAIPWREAIETGAARPIGAVDIAVSIEQTPPDLTEWEKVVKRYEEFAKQSNKQVGIGFKKPAGSEGPINPS